MGKRKETRSNFYGRFRARVFSDTLRAFAEGKIEGGEPAVEGGPKISDVPELDLLFREVFISPDTFVNMNPLDPTGRSYWNDLVTEYERGRSEKARELAAGFADWLDDAYQKRERLQFDDSTFSILLDGELYAGLRPEGYAILTLLASCPGYFLSGESLIEGVHDLATTDNPVFKPLETFPAGSAGIKRISRAIKYLPPELRQIIDGKKGIGRRLCLRPL